MLNYIEKRSIYACGLNYPSCYFYEVLFLFCIYFVALVSCLLLKNKYELVVIIGKLNMELWINIHGQSQVQVYMCVKAHLVELFNLSKF